MVSMIYNYPWYPWYPSIHGIQVSRYQKNVVSTHPYAYSLSKVFNSLWMGPYLVYFSMSNWIYPLTDYIGETGCYLMNIFRAIHLFEVQLQSFFISLFRFVCLFHGGLLQKINLSPKVRDKRPIHSWLPGDSLVVPRSPLKTIWTDSKKSAQSTIIKETTWYLWKL